MLMALIALAASRGRRQSPECHPLDLDALRVLANIKETLSLPQEAKPIFERIVAAKPDDAVSLLGLGQCEMELKNYQAAVDLLQRVLRLDPAQINAHFFLSRALGALGRTAEAKHEAELHHVLVLQSPYMQPKE
jgi:tetratricopeptide (TPR) repeat protein